jgi:hypothetical protein
LAEAAVEGFDVCVVAGLSWPREVQLDLIEVGPLVKQTSGELRAIVDTNASRLAPDLGNPVEYIDHLVGAEVGPRNGRKSLSRVAVHNRQDPEGTAVKQLVGHEVHCPDIVDRIDLGTPGAITAGSRPRTAKPTFVADKWGGLEAPGKQAEKNNWPFLINNSRTNHLWQSAYLDQDFGRWEVLDFVLHRLEALMPHHDFRLVISRMCRDR